MIIKEKRWLSRIVAMLCVLTMVVGVLTPASVGVAAADKVEKVIIKVVQGIKYIDSCGDDMSQTEEYAGDDGYVKDAYYKYKYDRNTNQIECLPLEGKKNFQGLDNFIFKIEQQITSADPEFECDPKGVNISITNTSKNTWNISVPLTSRAVNQEVITITPVIQYSVTFNKDNGSKVENIKVGEDAIEGNNNVINVKNGAEVTFSASAINTTSQKVNVTVDGAELTDNNNGTYKLTVNSKNVTVNITTVNQEFTITPPSEVPGYKYKAVSTSPVAYNGSFSFYVTPQAGYNPPKVYVHNGESKSETDLVEPVDNNLYVISEIKEDKKIEIVSTDKVKYDVLFEEGIGYEIECTSAPDGHTNIAYGEELDFSVVLNTGYEISKVAANGTPLTATTTPAPGSMEQKYSYQTTITATTTINVIVKKISYKVDYNEVKNDGSKAFVLTKGAESVEYGNTCTFYVKPKPGYPAPTVDANGKTLDPVNGTQYETIITETTTITITASNINSQTITFNSGTGYEFTKEDGSNIESSRDSVEYGTVEYKFKLKLGDNYNKSTPIVTINNGIALTGTKDPESAIYTYSIKNITEDQTVTVSGVQLNTYTVTLNKGTGYTITTTDPTKVTAGDSFRFSVVANPGYEKITKEDISTTGNQKVEVVQQEDNGDYIIKELTSDTIITVAAPEKEKYTVTTTELSSAHAKITSAPANVEYGANYSFEVKVDKFHKLETVAINGVPASPVNGKYTVSKVIDNSNYIEIVTKPVELTINYVDEKFSSNSKSETYSVENENNTYVNVDTGKVELWEPDNTTFYNFAGWDQEEVSLSEHEDTNITLKAKWELNKDVVKNGLTLTTEGSWSGSANDYKVLFKTVISVASNGNTEDYKQNVKIKAFGTLYSPYEITSIEDKNYAERIKTRALDSTEADTLMKQELETYVFSYYKDLDEDLSVKDLGEKDFFSLKLTSKRATTRHAVGWLEVEIDGETVIIFGTDKSVVIGGQS